jgi:hypothetical protein
MFNGIFERTQDLLILGYNDNLKKCKKIFKIMLRDLLRSL